MVWKGYFRAEWEHPEWHALEALLWASVVLFLLVAPLRGRALLRNPVLEGVGRISYSLYLVHLPILFFALFPVTFGGNPKHWDAASAARVLGALAVSLALSAASYRFIERPFLARRAPGRVARLAGRGPIGQGSGGHAAGSRSSPVRSGGVFVWPTSQGKRRRGRRREDV